MAALETLLAKHLEPGEVLRGAVPAFTGGGFGRRILGITDRRLIVLRSNYAWFTDRGLLWADDVRTVRLDYTVHMTSGVGGGASGNAYVSLIRGDGEVVPLNIRRGFLFLPQTEKHVAAVFDLLPNRV